MPLAAMPLFSLLKKAALPRSRNEDRARREFILNVLLLSAMALLAVAILVNAANIVFSDPASHAASSFSGAALCGMLLYFVGLYALSRVARTVLASYLFLAAFFILTAYMGVVWGVDVPAQIVFYPLVIVMAGVLISTRVAFLATLLITLTMVTTAYLETVGIISANTYWKTLSWTWSDLTMIVLIYLVVATVSWLSNREIEKSLRRARRSEAALKQERDTLEVRVEERTRELRQAEMEKMSQAYRFVEFGRLAGGIFHDLMNPLAALSLNINRIADAPGTRTALSGDVARAKQAAAHMQRLMESMRKHLAREGNAEIFSAEESLKEVLQILTPYAHARNVRLSLQASGPAQLYGDPVAFAQVMTNLISNAIQSYSETRPKTGVMIAVEEKPDSVFVRIVDSGVGIREEDLARIFEPFFTTKEAAQGLGIGLSLAKRLVEKNFGGILTVESIFGKGSTFTVYLPVREPLSSA